MAWIAAGLVVAQALTWTGRLDGARRGAGDGPTTIALDAEVGRVFVGFWNSRTVEAVDPAEPSRRVSVVTGHRPTQLGWLPRSKALVFACYYEDHLCVVPAISAGGEVRCFAPGEGGGGERSWGATPGRHSSFARPHGTFHGHVESFVVDDDQDRIYPLAGHFSGIGLDKDFEWLSSARWDGERLLADGPGLTVRVTSHDHDAQPLAIDGSAGVLWWTSPSERVVRRVRVDGLVEEATSGPLGTLPVAMAVDRGRRVVWVGDGVRAELRAIDADTLVPTERLSTPTPVSALAFDDATGALWVVSRRGGTLGVLDAGAKAVRPVYDVDQPSAVVLDPVRRLLWVASLGDGVVHRLAAPASSAR
ncbi:MAG: hypothetical protein IPK07_35885 [Deltaproteobacteria bacterium]|nr:hypothetical protein [Deltaproteobacteria bacterium]